MKLNTLCIRATHDSADKPNLTLIHGWGAESRVWESWVKQQFADDFNVTLIDLPGFGDSPVCPEKDNLQENWLQALEAALPEKTHLLGWSLGGLLAQQLALRNPDKIQSLICLATTPRFTQNDGWTKSVSPKIINDFIKAISIETLNTLKTFWRMQLQGTAHSRQLMKDLVKHMSSRSLPGLKALNQGLILLKDMDNREQLASLQMPTLWLLGEHDPLIPQEIKENLPNLQPGCSIEIIADGSHIPFFSHPQETADSIKAFLKQR